MVNYYNTLLDVEDASEALHAHPNFEEFLRTFAPLTAVFDMQDVVGANLLHRHFTLDEGQLMVESFESWEGQPALVSRPSDGGGVRTPSTWRLDPHGSLEPLEYSRDPGVSRATLEVSPEFIADYASLLSRLELQPLLGLTVLQRDSLAPSAGQQYHEDTFEGASVVVAVPNDEAGVDAITTVWAAGEFMGCTVYNTCHTRNSCHYANEQHRHVLGHTTERGHHR